MQKCKHSQRLSSLLILVAMACVGLCACTLPAKPPAKTRTAMDNPSNSARILPVSAAEYAATMLAANTDVQRKEVLQLTQRLATSTNQQQNTGIRMKLAILYGMPASQVRDAGKGLALLDELLRSPQKSTASRSNASGANDGDMANSLNAQDTVFAGLLRDYLAESAKLNLKWRDEQKRADSAQSKLDSLQLKLEGMQGKSDSWQLKAETLQRKLDELKNIEKTMTERGGHK